jgi:hypothetical protein
MENRIRIILETSITRAKVLQVKISLNNKFEGFVKDNCNVEYYNSSINPQSTHPLRG